MSCVALDKRLTRCRRLRGKKGVARDEVKVKCRLGEKVLAGTEEDVQDGSIEMDNIKHILYTYTISNL